MKKKLIPLFVAIVVMVLTGCSKTETLTCTKTNNNNDYNEEIAMIIKYDSKTNIISNVSTTYKQTSDEETAELNKSIYDLVFIKYNSVDGISTKTNIIDKKTLEYTIDIDKNKLSVDDYNNLLNTTTNKTFLNSDLSTDIKINDYKVKYLYDYNCK